MFESSPRSFNAEFGRYLSTSADESDLFPTTLAGDRLQDISAVAKPATWTQLKIQPGRSGLYCQYGTIAGASGNAAGMGVVGLDIFGGAAPTSTWFYVLARCNFDNDPTVDSLYAARGDLTETYKENEGR